MRNFSALAGSPPTALYACIAGDFVMTGNQGGARGRVQWSAINNSADWVTSQQTQASQQDLPDGGLDPGADRRRICRHHLPGVRDPAGEL